MSRFLDAIRVNNTIDKSWEEFFKDPYIINELETIEKKLICNYTPCDSKVLRFATVDLTKVKVIIFGQDPYPQKGRATGRSFEVGDISDWNDTALGNDALVNILKLIYKSYQAKKNNKSIKNITNYDINEVRREITRGTFKIRAMDEVFKYWESKGVLFLNTAFTSEIDNPGQHLSDWRCFNNKLIKYIINKNPNIKYFLWGDEIQVMIKSINEFNSVSSGLVYECSHPTATNVKKGTKFDCSDCFIDTFDEIEWVED